MATTLGLVGPAAPARADIDVCSAIGTVTLAQAYDLTPRDVTTTFQFTWTTGLCSIGGAAAMPLHLDGTVTGICNMARGTGISTDGHAFALDWVGGDIVLSGQLTGTFAITPSLGQSCISGANQFDVRGTFTKSHLTWAVDVCTGEFKMSLSKPFELFPPSPTTASFTIQMTKGTCTLSLDLTVTGTLTGSCIHAMGVGVTNTGLATTLEWWLPYMSFLGLVTGSTFVTDDPLSPGDCTKVDSGSPSAGFILAGTLVRL